MLLTHSLTHPGSIASHDAKNSNDDDGDDDDDDDGDDDDDTGESLGGADDDDGRGGRSLTPAGHLPTPSLTGRKDISQKYLNI